MAWPIPGVVGEVDWPALGETSGAMIGAATGAVTGEVCADRFTS